MSQPAEPAPPVPPIPPPPLPAASPPPSAPQWAAPPAPPLPMAPSPAPSGAAPMPVAPTSGPLPYPPTFTAPYAAPGAYAPPPGYAGPYLASPTTVASIAAAPRPATGSGLGLVALLAALAATVVPGIAIVIAAFNIGLGAGREIALRPMDIQFDWSALTPVRDWVLLAEVSFWVGTALGVWAIIQGIVAIAKNRGRGLGIAAVVVAVLGLIVFVIALQSALTAGLAAGTGIGG